MKRKKDEEMESGMDYIVKIGKIKWRMIGIYINRNGEIVRET